MSGYPFEVQNGTVGVDLLQRGLVEGDPLQLFANNSGAGVAVAAGAVNTVVIASTQPPRIGKIFFADTALISLDNPAVAQLGVGGDTVGRFPGISTQVLIGANAPIAIPVRALIRGFAFQNGIFGVNVRNNLNAGSVTYKGSVTVNGFVITDDLNFSAKHTLGFFGDSTLNGTGPTTTASMWPFIVRDWLIAQGFDCRNILKSVSGSTSGDHEGWRKAGWHGALSKYAMGFYNLGINDAGAGVSAATALANATAFWTWWDKKYPKAPLVIVGITPLENNTSETAAAAIRSAVAAWVTSVASPRLKYVATEALWDRTVASNYAGTDAAGSRVHYTDAPHALVAGAITTMLAANNFTRPNT